MSVGNGETAKPDVESGGASGKKENRETTKKIIRVLTVMAYLSSVSLAAIMLSLYYIFLWNPSPPSQASRTMPLISMPFIKIPPGSHIKLGLRGGSGDDFVSFFG